VIVSKRILDDMQIGEGRARKQTRCLFRRCCPAPKASTLLANYASYPDEWRTDGLRASIAALVQTAPIRVFHVSMFRFYSQSVYLNICSRRTRNSTQKRLQPSKATIGVNVSQDRLPDLPIYRGRSMTPDDKRVT